MNPQIKMNRQLVTRLAGNRRPARLSRRALPLVALALSAGCGGGDTEANRPAEERSTGSLTRSLFNDAPELFVGEAVDFMTLGFDFGDPEAPLRIAELSDFGCGYCRKFHEETFPVLQDEYMDAGTVLWKYIPVVTGMFPHGDLSALSGECAGEQGAFESMLERLFQDQAEWKGSSDPMPHFLGYASDLGLNAEQFRSCISEERPEERLAAGKRASRALGLRGTPSFLINGFPVQGALPTQLFRDILDNELAALEQAVEPGN